MPDNWIKKHSAIFIKIFDLWRIILVNSTKYGHHSFFLRDVLIWEKLKIVWKAFTLTIIKIKVSWILPFLLLFARQNKVDPSRDSFQSPPRRHGSRPFLVWE